MKNKNGFTLIELLAVIIILGILMIIAIPSVTRYISDSRKSSYVDTAKEIISGTRNKVNDGKLRMFDPSATYYIPSSYIKTENASKSPYGEFTEAYIAVIYDGKGYKYYWISVDDAGQGVKNITPLDKLDEDDIESDLTSEMIKNTVEHTVIGNRNKILILDPSDETWKEPVGEITSHVSEEEGGGSSGGSGSGTTPSNIVCKPATTLHTATCNRTSNGCYAAGYYSGGSKDTTTITYGNETTTSGTLTSGDAFDCDVNDDGTWDPDTERFYYVSPLYDSSITGDYKFDDDYAVLIYYANVTVGEASNTGYAYATKASATYLGYTCTQNYGCNNYGPLVGYAQLPSTTQWSNSQLIEPGTRQITTETGTTSTSGGTIESFTYTDKAARLMTYQEVQAACGYSVTSTGNLDNCNYLLENTLYEASSGKVNYWLESPCAYYSNYVWSVGGHSRDVLSAGPRGTYGFRPAITVALENIDY